MEIIVPKPSFTEDGNPYPTLGPQVVDFIESHFTFGPGPLKGEPYKVRDEFRYLIYRAYEHYPEGHQLDFGDGFPEDVSGRRRFQQVNISLPKGSAKCVAPDTEFITEDGSRVKASDLTPGMSVQSYLDGEVVYRKVVAVEEQPLAMTYRVETDHGRSIEVSEGHPFLVSGTQWREGMPKFRKYTANDPKAGLTGWSKVEDLAPGDRLVPAMNWKTGGTAEEADLGWLLGVIAGDASGDGRFTNNDEEIVDKVSKSFDLTTLTKGGEIFKGNFYMRGARDLFRDHDFQGKNAYEKRVPEQVMKGSRSMALGYLAGMLDTDGCTTYRPLLNGKTRRGAEWYSVSEQNMRDLHTLLASVGFNADVREKKSTYNGEPFVSWTVVISNKADLKRLAEVLPVVRHRNVENFKQFRIADARGQFADVNLDKVKRITPIGMTKTIGVEIEDTHVHVTNGLVTHNTELMSIISLTELHPDAPVRFNGYDPNAEGGMAPGRSVVSPFIPLLAPTKEQLNDLAYGAVMVIAAESDPDVMVFDVNKERVMVVGESESKIVPVAAAGSRLDGLKPTFQGIDEPHRLFEDRHRDAYRTMLQNLPKRKIDDPWQLTCTTAGDPSEPSIARDHYRLGVSMEEGLIEEPNTFFYHRGTSDENAKFDTMAERMRALREASGEEAAQFRDLRAVAAMWDNEGNDKAYLERVWCNRWVQSSANAFDVDAFRALGDERIGIEPGSTITLGFDGAVTDDSTALVATEVASGAQVAVGLWEKPANSESWSVPVSDVNAVVDFCFENYDVFFLYYDPPFWQEAGAIWDEKYPGKVIEWPTRNLNRIYYAVRAYQEAIASGELAHDGDPNFIRHIANAGRNEVNSVDEEGRKKFRLAKLAPHRKYDAAMAAVISWQARLDAIKKGARSNGDSIEVPVRVR